MPHSGDQSIPESPRSHIKGSGGDRLDHCNSQWEKPFRGGQGLKL